MYEAYRVRKRFGWRGWELAPRDDCYCHEGNSCPSECTGEVGSGCEACPPEACRCSCNILPERYGGDIWIVEDGHPRKEMMLANRFAIYDSSLPLIEDLLKDPEIVKLLDPPKYVGKRKPLKRTPALSGIERVE